MKRKWISNLKIYFKRGRPFCVIQLYHVSLSACSSSSSSSFFSHFSVIYNQCMIPTTSCGSEGCQFRPLSFKLVAVISSSFCLTTMKLEIWLTSLSLNTGLELAPFAVESSLAISPLFKGILWLPVPLTSTFNIANKTDVSVRAKMSVIKRRLKAF